ncbi:hypothetical protein [Sporosarcina sp.]|uniref:hypothetical protein n=1 Tax=Sporosarcina sp. TaxID=49982 RepID=UPI002621EAFE|nr:hypothetical protein [Sporosarcina sp.]
MIIFTVVMPVLIILAVVIIWLVIKNMGKMRMKKSFHRKLIIGYIVLLFVVVIAAEIMEKKYDRQPPPKAPESAMGFDLRYAIEQRSAIPERLVEAKRTHEVKGEFSIPKFYEGAYILIERTSEESNTIEETVYKPELFAGYDTSYGGLYDLSDQLKIELPVWDDHSMRVPRQPQNHIQYTVYHDSNMLNQFNHPHNKSSSSSAGVTTGMTSGMMTIHLVIPESIQLEIPETGDEYEQYIELL